MPDDRAAAPPAPASGGAPGAAPGAAPLFAVLLAAGRGTRFRSADSKTMALLAGRPVAAWAAAAASGLSPARTLAVVPPGEEGRRVAAAAGAEPVEQAEPRGTAHAAEAALAALAGAPDEALALVAVADAPLFRVETLERLRRERGASGASSAWLAFRPDEPGDYGRMALDGAGRLLRIVEAEDRADDGAAPGGADGPAPVWAGVLLSSLGALRRGAPAVRPGGRKGETRIPDLAALEAEAGDPGAVVLCPPEEALGINDRARLAEAEAILQGRLRAAALRAGAGLVAPETLFLSHDTVLEPDCRVEPWVWMGPGVRVESGAVVRSFSHLEGARVGAGASVGPFARLRPGTALEEGARVGAFVEAKEARLGPGAKAPHLAYLGDVEVGAGANVGAGAITCNFDGAAKHRTRVGAGAMVGANASLVAPVELGDESVVGAGSVVTRDVPAGALAVARAPQALRGGPGAGARRLQKRAPGGGAKPPGGAGSKGG